ncbi:unnamed protein product [Cladocopium goreaui]|uniref:Kinesin-like protein KIF16B n=1 Tax=Cladocopium goreaui TaxID=2562237 RepID=A0A9P1FGC3_9DINO|nr:unnamed protein product [Cladocopium goreaui]|mmetsp:Transcript_49281/g.107305  ORF Transcript_49281/g.107305 Transcript_49281/m.107305 type:complete len:147 (-) Transcript_49281:210-650(-)
MFRMFRLFLCFVLALCSSAEPEAGISHGISHGIRGAGNGNVSRVLGGCELGLVNCGGCQCVEPSTCRWCHGMDGTSPVATQPASSCGVGKVNCGICRCTTRSSCATCDGQGGPAAVISAAAPIAPIAPLIQLQLVQLIFLGLPLFT